METGIEKKKRKRKAKIDCNLLCPQMKKELQFDVCVDEVNVQIEGYGMHACAKMSIKFLSSLSDYSYTNLSVFYLPVGPQ